MKVAVLETNTEPQGYGPSAKIPMYTVCPAYLWYELSRVYKGKISQSQTCNPALNSAHSTFYIISVSRNVQPVIVVAKYLCKSSNIYNQSHRIENGPSSPTIRQRVVIFSHFYRDHVPCQFILHLLKAQMLRFGPGLPSLPSQVRWIR